MSGLEDHLVTLIQRRNELDEERQRLGKPSADGPIEEFRKYMQQMRTVGAQILELDSQIEQVRSQLDPS